MRTRPSPALVCLAGATWLLLAAACTATSTDNPQANPPTTSSPAAAATEAPDRPVAKPVAVPANVSSAAISSVPPGHEVAILAGGCFWGMEEILRGIDGVAATDVGYTGGTAPNPTYEVVKTGLSGHAESVRVVFDPQRISFEELLVKWFFRMHDPTTLNQQGNDVGSQYRSAIFVTSPEQRQVAEAVKKRADESGLWKAPIVTEIADAGPFTPAEGYHQDYLQRYPDGYTCHFMRKQIDF